MSKSGNKGGLVFPVLFDLDAAVKQASKDWDGKYADQLQKAIQKRVMDVKLRLSTKNLDNLDDVKKRLSELKIEPLTPENKSSIKELVKELKSLAKIMNRIQNFRGIQLPELQQAQAAKLRDDVAKSNERLRLSQERVRQAEERLALAQKRSEQQARNTSQAYTGQSAALSQLRNGLAAYVSLSTVGNFLTNVREVTAEFELQRISLGAIIQDQERANQLFSEIKSFAIQSPVKLLDLTKYTKQLAAYKIETEELFDWTKRLTDISVGIGAPMSRIILAFGQIRAKGYLAASETKQITELGIPIVEELAAKLSKANDELVRASDVMDMMSKREIPFEMVAEVFKDMTDKGGMFYQMQEKQGNTLYGMWQKLGDAAAIMYDEIGNNESVNSSMKLMIGTLRSLMQNWKQVGMGIGAVTALMVAHAVAMRNAKLAAATQTAENIKNVASMKAKEAALVREIALTRNVSMLNTMSARATLAATRAQIQAATATNVFSKALYGMKAALLSNPLGILVVALTSIIGLFAAAEDKALELQSKLTDIETQYGNQGKQMKERFVELANVATGSVDGSKRQKDALDELNRTYRDILGSEALEIESLRNLGGQYGELTNLIDVYNAKKKGTEMESAIKSNYGERITDAKDRLTDYLRAYGASDDEITNFFIKLQQDLQDGVDGVVAMQNRLNEVTHSNGKNFVNLINVFDPSKLVDTWQEGFREIGNGFSADFIFDYIRLQKEEGEWLDANTAKTREATNALGSYANDIDNLNTAFAELDWSSMESLYNSFQSYNANHPTAQITLPIDLTYDPAKADSEYEKLLEIANMKTSAVFTKIQEIAREEGVIIPTEFYVQAKSVVDGNKDFSFVNWDALIKLPFSDKARSAIKAGKQLVEDLAPSDETARVFNRKFMELADGMDMSLDKMKKYLMTKGTTLEEHRKSLSDNITALLKDIARLQWTKRMQSMFGLPTAVTEAEIEKNQQEVALLQKAIADIPDIESIGKKNKSKKSDTRLQVLNEIEQSLTTINSKYEELLKKEGKTEALEHINEIFGSQLTYLNKIGKRFGLTFEMPTSFKSLQEYRAAILNVIDGLRKSKLQGAEKAALELEMKIGEDNVSELQKQLTARLKALSDKVSRTKVAKDFYDKILNQTGSYSLAANLSVAVYGDTGRDIQRQIVEQIQKYFSGVDVALPINLSTGDIDYKALRGIWEADKSLPTEMRKIPQEYDSAIKSILDSGDAVSKAQAEQWLKDLEKAKTYSDKRIQLAQYTANQIAEIEKKRKALDPNSENYKAQRQMYDDMINGYRQRESKQADELSFEAFKDMPIYVQMFADLDKASTSMLTNMRDKLTQMQGAWKNLSPTQLKELQNRLSEIDAQLAKRNPFKTLSDAFKEYRELRNGGTKSDADKGLKYATDNYLAAKKELERVLNENPNDEEAVNNARQLVNSTEEAQKEAEKLVERWSKVEKAIGLSSNEIFGILGSLSDVAAGIGKLTQVFGGDEEDVQYWNDIADGLNEVTSGIENMVQAALSGNPIGIVTSAITAIPNMISGFAGLFSAGKVRKANKEIKKQQKILEQLEYTYNRLQAAADKLFGADYTSNYNQQMNILQARQQALLKQADAERSKGKKEDKAKTQEYLNQAREVADQIADMEKELTAHFTGTSRQDAAKEFARSWLDAKTTFASTTDAIKSKYRDMLKSMIVEGAMAKIVDNALAPLWDQMDKAYAANDPMKAIEIFANGFNQFVADADNGLNVMWNALEARGLDLKNILKDTSDTNLTGIARNIATASEESISGLAAMTNTNNFYVAQILEEVRHIREGKTVGDAVISSPVDYSPMWKRNYQMQQLANQHLAETLAECRAMRDQNAKSLVAIQAIKDDLHRVVSPRGTKSSYEVNVRLS